MSKPSFIKYLPLSLDEKIAFFMELSAYIKSAVPITTSLTKIIEYSHNPKIKEVASKILRAIDSKNDFSVAILKFEPTLGSVYCNLLSVGAQTGELPKITQDILNSLKTQRRIKRNIIKACIYPAILIIMLLVFTLVLIFFIAPRIATQAEYTSIDVPLAIKILAKIGKLLSHIWLLIPIIIVLFIYAIINYFKELLKKEAIFRIPIIGNAVKIYNLSLFAKTFSISYAAGIPVTSCYILSSKTLANNYLKNKLLLCSGMLEEKNISKTFAATGIFSPQIISNIESGEISGTIDEILNEISNNYDEQLDTTIIATIRAIEPVLTIIIAIFVLLFGFIIMDTANPLNYI